MSKRVLVVPDVHGRSFWKEPVRKYIDHVDRIVFLGDYLDPYRDEGEEHTSESVYDNLMEIIQLKLDHKEKVILLKGNHDQHYSSRRFYDLARGSRCDKINWDKFHKAFNQNKDLFQLAYLEIVNDIPYVFSHAGLTVYWLNKVNSKIWRLSDSGISLADQNIIDQINLLDDDGIGQEMLAIVGKSRSMFLGEKTGSILWADIEEHPLSHSPKAYGLNKVFQIFGHTRLDGMQEEMIASDHLAMVDSQKCFIIDDSIKKKIMKYCDYEDIMIEEWFKKRYSKRIEWSKNFTDLEPICFFLHELIDYDEEILDRNLPFIRIIEKGLLDRGILSFKIESPEDIYKVGEIDSVAKKIQYFICLALKFKEESWRWDKNENRYICKAEREKGFPYLKNKKIE